jgi:UPF0176 protein
MPAVVAAFCQFGAVPNPQAGRAALHGLAVELDLDLKGTLIVVGESINATLAGVACTIDALVAALQAGLPVLPLMTRLDLKRAQACSVPFGRLKVKHKPKIVTLAVPGRTRHGGSASMSRRRMERLAGRARCGADRYA